MTLPGEPCKVEPQPGWTKQEKWVWKQVCEGKIADFNEGKDYGGELKPQTSEKWPKKRVLRPEFLETILLQEPYRSALTRHGVRIVGAWFVESLDLSNATIPYQLWLDRCRFEASVNFYELRTHSLISLEGSKFTGTLNMSGLQVGGDLFMRDGAEFADVDFRSAKVRGTLAMTGSKFTGTLNMDKLQVESSLFMSGGAEFADVVLRSAKVRGQLAMIGSQFTGTLNMNGLQVDSSLFMHTEAKFAEVDLGSAKVGGQLAMNGSNFTGTLNMDKLQVESSLFMHDGAEFADVVLRSANVRGQLVMDWSKFTGTLIMERLQIGRDLFMRGAEVASKDKMLLFNTEIKGDLDISNSKLPSLDLTGTKIHGEFCLGSPDLPSGVWHQDAVLTLRKTEVGTFIDRKDAWPKKLELVGFTYARLPRDVATRDASWFINEWLVKQTEYSPQPYQQLASVLRKAGHRRKANDVLYAGKERERKQAKGRQRTWLTALKWFIGYGYRTRYTLRCALALIGIGVFFLWASDQGPVGSLLDRIYYTLDTLLPIIELDRERHTFTLTGIVRAYFYGLKIMGYVLASFLAAGITGLTEKA